MSETIAKLALGPLLLLQGHYTRWATPTLPEAFGVREGIRGEGAALRIVIVGDSAAAGVGVPSQDEALAGRLVSRLAQTHRVAWRLVARSGVDTQALLQLLAQSATDPFDIAVVSIGVNDVTSSIRLAEWRAGQGRLLDLLRDKYGVAHIVLAPIPPMHAFPALPQPLRWYLGDRARRFNQHRYQLVSARRDCSLLVNDFPLRAELMAEDGFHPGPAIYSQWADEAATSIHGFLNAAQGEGGARWRSAR
ncbi:SGNH/GDSL hydrolase family protein [Chitinivorax sp. PXF-14]|uniref:SGNH/GDSL hydrolase family protein n=1 Tax=Chitinivorax sp. PXF-14 TaxID=3230488 RepID=UPI0034678DFD